MATPAVGGVALGLTPSAQGLPAYAELHCRSNFTFLTGASHPEELVARAHELGYTALAITDECSLAGVVRAHSQARRLGLHLIVGAEMRLAPSGEGGCNGPRLVLLAQSRRGYGNLAQWITVARRRAGKGRYTAQASDVEGRVPHAPYLAGLPDCFALMVVDAALPFESQFAHAMWLKTWFGVDRAALVVPLLHRAHDAACIEAAERMAALTGLPLAAAGDVLMHVRARKPLQDALTATRLAKPVAECGFALEPNAEAHLRSRQRLASLYPADWLAATVRIAASCAFSLDELRYEYPEEIVPEGHTPASWLRTLTEAGARKRFPTGVPTKVRDAIEYELALIARLQYEPYFLTVADVVTWAREQKILCQGRGSAANSTVCYCLGVTEVDPARTELLFERFVSAERNEPPDIDVDFEHQRREEVIQYIYRKYGRHRAALTAVVISYRPRSALRDMGRAMGIDLDRIAAVARGQHWFDGRGIQADRLRENGLDPDSPICRLWVELTQTLIGFPRHLSQHPGGFVIARDDVSRLVPVENAAMDDRTVIQWDKDDLDTLGLIKVDVLALGMLSAVRRALELVAQKLGVPGFSMQDVLRPGGVSEMAEDQSVYDMLSRGDSVGTFQVESRAQMSMLPRLKPKNFYDLVIEVAIVRPGPIQGGMVHPYLKRRNGEEPVDYPSAEVKQALQRTLGVPIFQEQVMQLAILAADFTPGEADALRRAMAAWKRKGGLGPFHERLVGRMVEKGYDREYAERIFKQIEGF
ncbi:MAG TPA: error-prone DNA polymerase, partial [Burkholderiaceae bacterium]